MWLAASCLPISFPLFYKNRTPDFDLFTKSPGLMNVSPSLTAARCGHMYVFICIGGSGERSARVCFKPTSLLALENEDIIAEIWKVLLGHEMEAMCWRETKRYLEPLMQRWPVYLDYLPIWKRDKFLTSLDQYYYGISTIHSRTRSKLIQVRSLLSFKMLEVSLSI